MNTSQSNPEQFKKCHRLNIRGHAHYLTFTCFHNQPLLAKDRSRQWFIDALIRARRLYDFHILGWVIMPEHIHLLLWPQYKEYDISKILRSLKQPVTNAALDFLKEHAPQFMDHLRDVQPNGKSSYRFWQRGGGFDRNTWTSEELWEKIHYIHLNPVRRGLVKRPEEWAWSSAQDFMGLRAIPLVPLDRQSLPEKR